MAFIETETLINNYGQELRDGSISSEKLGELLAHQGFTTSTDHTAKELYEDFVKELKLDGTRLHLITERVLTGVSIDDLRREESLAKAFLNDEYTRFPINALGHLKNHHELTQFENFDVFLEALSRDRNNSAVETKSENGAPAVDTHPEPANSNADTASTSSGSADTRQEPKPVQDTDDQEFLQEVQSSGKASSEEIEPLDEDEPLEEVETLVEENVLPTQNNEVDRNAYLNALHRLQHYVTSKRKSDGESPLLMKIQDLIDHVAILGSTNRASLTELKLAIDSTISLLSKDSDMPIEKYQKIANNMQGKRSVGLAILGGLMFAVGLLAVGAGIALFATGLGAAPGAALGLVGGVTAAAGAGFFMRGVEQTGLAKGMSDVAGKFSRAEKKAEKELKKQAENKSTASDEAQSSSEDPKTPAEDSQTTNGTEPSSPSSSL